MARNTQEYIEANWDQAKGRIKEAYGAVTDDDLRRAEGRYDQLVGVIKQRTNQDRKEIERRLDDMFREVTARR